MAAIVEVSQTIDRPVADVFHWYADDHVRNHPRWDPDIELWLESDAPIRVGTVIRRRNSRSGAPVEGTMEVVEYAPNRAFGAVIHDGPFQMRGRAVFEEVRPDRTELTLSVEIPEPMDPGVIRSGMERSLARIKHLIEDEI